MVRARMTETLAEGGQNALHGIEGSHLEAFEKFSVAGRTVRRWVVPSRGHAAFPLQRGQSLRFVDLEGKQVPDLVCFNAHDLDDHLNLGNSQALNSHWELREGDVLASVDCNTMMTIVGYSNETSFCGSMCSEQLNLLRYGVGGTPNCRDNLTAALAPWGIGRRQIPNALSIFMRVDFNPDRSMPIMEPSTEPGDYYDLRAEMDLLVGVSNCPQERNPCNGFKPTPLGIVIYEP